VQGDEFDDIPPPASLAYIYGYFLDLHYASKEGISYQDIEAYCNATQNRLSIYEVNLIRQMSSWAASEINKAWRENN